jgi:hypothetical protein
VHIAALRPMPQRVVHQHQRQHGLGNRRGADADAGVVATKGFHRRRAGRSCRSTGAGVRMELVGLMAMDTVMSWPVEMPPSTPPALLPPKPSRRQLVAVHAAFVG